MVGLATMRDSPLHDARRTGGMNGVLFLLGLSVFINYIDRANLSVAADLLKAELSLSHAQLGILLAAFFWTYSFMQLLVGWLVDRFEAKWFLPIRSFSWSLATPSTPSLP